MYETLIHQFQLKTVFSLEMKLVYQVSKTTEVMELRTTESNCTIKQSLPVTSLSVIKCVGTSQNGEWMYTLEVVVISIDTLLIFKCGDHHPQWMTPLAQASTAW